MEGGSRGNPGEKTDCMLLEHPLLDTSGKIPLGCGRTPPPTPGASLTAALFPVTSVLVLSIAAGWQRGTSLRLGVEYVKQKGLLKVDIVNKCMLADVASLSQESLEEGAAHVSPSWTLSCPRPAHCTRS